MHDIQPSTGATTRRVFIQRAGVGLVAVAGLPALLRTGVAGAATGARPAGRFAASTPIVPGGTLVGALTGEPDTLDPATSVIYTGAQVYDNIFSKLIDIDTDGSFYGVLATQWNATDDVTWVFDLVPDGSFHNGEPFTPADVVYTFQRIADPATASAYAGLFVADRSVTATGRRPGDVPPEGAVRAVPHQPRQQRRDRQPEGDRERRDPSRNPVGTGPFKFVEWVQGQHVKLEKNPDYFKPASRRSTPSSSASCSSTRAASTGCARASCTGSTRCRSRSCRR